MRNYLLLLLLCFTGLLTAQPDIELDLFASGLSSPVDIAHAGDSRLFIVERSGLIIILDENGNELSEPFLDINNIVINTSGQSERGLLGLAFHPNYKDNGYFYVNYIANDGNTRISRFSVDPNDPDKGDPSSELQLMTVVQPFSNHNGGCLKFGPDGYLYIGLGDGGSADDPLNNGQDRLTFLGKLLRIDVDNGNPYAIPPDNPFVNDDFTLDEIWSIGLRNPWRFSFDRETGDLWIADVGQNEFEEINFQPFDSEGGENYGWRCYEGDDPFITGGCEPASAYVFPVQTYSHPPFPNCASVTGGFVYRGAEIPDLTGWYLYADYCLGTIWGLQNNGGTWENVELGDFNQNFSSFGENVDGELFVATFSNRIYKIRLEGCGAFGAQASIQNDCDAQGTGAVDFNVSGGQPPVEITPSETSGLSAGNYSFTISDNQGCIISQSIEIANFDTPTAPSITVNNSELSIPDNFGYYQWYLDNMPINGANGPMYDATTNSGEYYVEVSNSSQAECLAQSDPVTYNFVNVKELDSENGISISPNPVSDHLIISWKQGLAVNSVKIYNASGYLIYFNQISNDLNLKLDFSDEPAGFYIIVVETDKGLVTEKVVK